MDKKGESREDTEQDKEGGRGREEELRSRSQRHRKGGEEREKTTEGMSKNQPGARQPRLPSGQILDVDQEIDQETG